MGGGGVRGGMGGRGGGVLLGEGEGLIAGLLRQGGRGLRKLAGERAPGHIVR